VLDKSAQGFAVRRTQCTSQPEIRGERRTAPTMKNEVLRQKGHLWMDTRLVDQHHPARELINPDQLDHFIVFGEDFSLIEIARIINLPHCQVGI